MQHKFNFPGVCLVSNTNEKFFQDIAPYRLVDILIYVQQDAALQSLFYLETALHVSGDTTTHHQESKQLYLHHLVFVRPGR